MSLHLQNSSNRLFFFCAVFGGGKTVVALSIILCSYMALDMKDLYLPLVICSLRLAVLVVFSYHLHIICHHFA